MYVNLMSLLKKIAQQSQNEKFLKQREMIKVFSSNYQVKFRTILNIMEGDLFTLRAKEFNKKEWEEFGILWRELIEIYKSLNDDKPYENCDKLISFYKMKQSFIENLDKKIQRFLKENKLDFMSGRVLVHPKVKSLWELEEFVNYIKHDMESNPIVEGLEPLRLKNTPSITPIQMGQKFTRIDKTNIFR